MFVDPVPPASVNEALAALALEHLALDSVSRSLDSYLTFLSGFYLLLYQSCSPRTLRQSGKNGSGRANDSRLNPRINRTICRRSRQVGFV